MKGFRLTHANEKSDNKQSEPRYHTRATTGLEMLADCSKRCGGGSSKMRLDFHNDVGK
jgi:hypothetical protein